MAGIQTSMGAHKLEIRQGDIHTTPNGVGALAPALLANAGGELAAVVAGACFSKNSAGFLVPGILATLAAGGGPNPLFLIHGNDENTAPAVRRDRGMPAYGSLPAGGNPFWGVPETTIAGASGPYSFIFGAAGGVELTTTRFDAGGAYAEGTLLTAVSAAAGNVGVRGVIRPVAAATDVVIGLVTGLFTSPDGYSTLAFIPRYTPGTTVPTDVI